MKKNKFNNYEEFLLYYITNYDSDFCSLILQSIVAKRVIISSFVLFVLLILYYFLLINGSYGILDMYVFTFFSLSLGSLIVSNLSKYIFYYLESIYFLKQIPLNNDFLLSLQLIKEFKPGKNSKYIEQTIQYAQKYCIHSYSQ